MPICLSVCRSTRLIFSNTFQWPIYKLVTHDSRTTYSTVTDLIYRNIPYHQANLAIKYIHDIVPWYHAANVPYHIPGTVFFPYHTVYTYHTTYGGFPIFPYPIPPRIPYSHIPYHQHIPYPIPPCGFGPGDQEKHTRCAPLGGYVLV